MPYASIASFSFTSYVLPTPGGQVEAIWHPSGIPRLKGKEEDTRRIDIRVDRKEPQLMTRAAIELYRMSGGAYSIHLLERLADIGAVWTATKPKNGHAPIRLDCNIGGHNLIAILMPFSLDT